MFRQRAFDLLLVLDQRLVLLGQLLQLRPYRLQLLLQSLNFLLLCLLAPGGCRDVDRVRGQGTSERRARHHALKSKHRIGSYGLAVG